MCLWCCQTSGMLKMPNYAFYGVPKHLKNRHFQTNHIFIWNNDIKIAFLHYTIYIWSVFDIKTIDNKTTELE